MPSRIRLAAVLIALSAGTLWPSLARAGEFAVEGLAGYTSLTASRSAEAVLGSSGGFTGGAAGRYTFYRGFYANVSFRTFSGSGERVFVAGPTDPVSKLGFPLKVRITPIAFTAGYRFRDGSLIVPYGGLGAAVTAYSEESSVAGISYDRSTTKTGFVVAGGVEIGRGRFRFGSEFSWSTVPNAIGLGGVSEVYGEDDIGGWAVVGKVVVAFGGRKKASANAQP